jgi:hypothetical protein
MTYDAQGNKIETGGGVFGDASAKSESIANSIEIMKNNSIEGLDYDNRLLKAFEKLSNALTGAAELIYTIPGLRLGGTTFGTQPGKKTLDKGGLFGTGFLGGVFGGGTTVTNSITSAGIQLRGSLDDIIQGTANSIMQYKDVQQQFFESGGWFGSDESWTESYRQLESVGGSVREAIADVFLEAKNVFTEIAAQAKISTSLISDAFKAINFQGIEGDIDSMGLSGTEALAQLNAIVSKKLDETASYIFFYFDRFKKFGEGFLETVVRVLDGNRKVDQSLRSMGAAFSIIGDYDVSESLIKAAGGLDTFMEQAEYFTQNFLTSAERLVPIRASVSKEMQRLGISLSTTKEDFKKLVLSQELGSAAGRERYQALIELAPGFNSAIEGITEQLSSSASKLEGTKSAFTDFAKNIRVFRESLLLSASSSATPFEKYSQAKDTFEKTYASALSGNKDAMSKVTSTAQTLLDLGKTFYASSDQYSDLFNYISSKLGSAEISALASADVAQLQLDAINNQVNLLTSIDANIATIAGSTPHANGGLATGWSLVGEKGPEMVNFSHPGQVYTAEQTAGMFSPVKSGLPIGALVSEIRQLKSEVVQLRKDQQKQTGDLIISNYDANQKSAEEITDAVTTASADSIWIERSKSQIK